MDPDCAQGPSLSAWFTSALVLWALFALQPDLSSSPLIQHRLPAHSRTWSCTTIRCLLHIACCLWPLFPLLDLWQTPSSMLPAHPVLPYIILLSLVLRLACFRSSFICKIRNNMRVAMILILTALFPGTCTVPGTLLVNKSFFSE